MNNQTLQHAALNWTDDGLPKSKQFDDLYFSSDNGIQETNYVFLQHNNLTERFTNNTTVTIGETGFGTGLNFLCAWQLRDQTNKNCALRFISVEKYPLTIIDLTKALLLWPELEQYTQQLLTKYSPNATGWQKIVFTEANVELLIYFGDALQGFNSNKLKIDAWFLDGFAPAKNPQMWTTELFQCITELSTANTSFATFTAAAIVKNGMIEAGFKIQKVKGFGRKRHMLMGTLRN